MKGNAVIGQSGGPTSVINASLAGAVSAALKNPNIETVFGMNYGIASLSAFYLDGGVIILLGRNLFFNRDFEEVK